jgi:ABC-type bacteriocin/lantibiotic exporter with double-glycine peptidase domain
MNEANNIMTISLSMMSLIVEFTAFVGISILLFLIEPVGMLFVVIILILIGYLFQKFLKSKLEHWGSIRQHLLGVMNLQISQGLGGIKKIILKNRQMFFINKYNIANRDNANIQTKINTISQFPRLFLELLAVIGIVGLLITMEAQGKKANFIISTLGIFVAASFRLIPSLNRIMTNLQTIQFLKPSITFINTELNKFKHTEFEKIIEHKFKSSVRFEEVGFKYLGSDNFVLKGISFDITKGQTIGIIGTSGSGKSTLIDLLLGLLVPTEGEICIDGIPLNKILYSWQKSVGYVSQDIYLMDDTLINNIVFGMDEKFIDHKMINKVIEDAQLSTFVSEQELGLYTNVGERGVKLSGGQKQRIGIARALYNNPEILVLDEATSALDFQTELDFINTLIRIKGEKTIIIIAHRLSTLKSCDYIIKLKNGRIIEKGFPRDIIKTI